MGQWSGGWKAAAQRGTRRVRASSLPRLSGEIILDSSGVPLGDGAELEERHSLPLHVGIGLRFASDPISFEKAILERACALRGQFWQEAAQAHSHHFPAPKCP